MHFRNMIGNPSECFFGYNPRSDSKEILCSCAKGFIDYDHGSCASVDCKNISRTEPVLFTMFSHTDNEYPCAGCGKRGVQYIVSRKHTRSSCQLIVWHC